MLDIKKLEENCKEGLCGFCLCFEKLQYTEHLVCAKTQQARARMMDGIGVLKLFDVVVLEVVVWVQYYIKPKYNRTKLS